MTRTVTARYPSHQDAENALARLSAQVAVLDSAVVSGGPSGALKLDSLNLTTEERSACREQLEGGGFLLLAQVPTDAAADSTVRILAERGTDWTSSDAPLNGSAPATASADDAVAEERIPILEEEIRVGRREVRRGGARVHSFTAEVPVHEDLELWEEQAGIERRPANRRLSDQEVEQGGLLRERVVEVSQMREEAVVSKEAFVREELVVKKKVEHRIEQIDETVRRTEVEIEALSPERRPAFGGLANTADVPGGSGRGEEHR